MRLKFFKDKKRRNSFRLKELHFQKLKSVSSNKRLSLLVRISATLSKTTRFSRNCSLTRIRNRCFITGRSRSVSSKFKVSRIIFRDFVIKGLFSGVRFSVW